MLIKIIAGEFKGRNLVGVSKRLKSGTSLWGSSGSTALNLRPILARVKKSLFDILNPKLGTAKFLDLYAGTGAVGIEAISRGAELTVFVDSNPDCIKIIKKNLDNLQINNRTRVYCGNVLAGFKWLIEKFDIIFIGPPYAEKLVTKTIDLILEAGILSSDGWIIAQHQQKEDVLTKQTGLKMFRRKKYGDTILSFFS